MDFIQSQHSVFAKCETTTKNKTIVIKGFFNYYDDFNRAKLMFLDDYDEEESSTKSFTKGFITNKSKNEGNNPLSKDEKCFFIKCKKGQVGLIDCCKDKQTATKLQPRLVPIIELIQHKVECIVQVNNYRFKKNEELIVGWNLKLLKIKLLEW
jgi:hypothetical protein